MSLLYIMQQCFIGTTHFQKGELIRDEQRNGIAHVANILKEDRRSSHRLIAEWKGIPKTIVQQILCKDLQKRKLCTRFVSHVWTERTAP